MNICDFFRSKYRRTHSMEDLLIKEKAAASATAFIDIQIHIIHLMPSDGISSPLSAQTSTCPVLSVSA